MKRAEQASRMQEIFRFLITGIICFAVEFILLVMLKEWFHLDTLIATPIAFMGSVAINYLMCVAWVFEGAKKNGHATKVGFFLTSAMGLLFNELFMLIFRLLFGEEAILFTILGFTVSMYMINKILATLLVMTWNYITKRTMLHANGLDKLQKRN